MMINIYLSFMVIVFYSWLQISLGMNTKIPNFEHSEHWMSKHRTFQTSHFGPKSNFEHVEHYKNQTVREHQTVCWFQRLVWSHNRTELRTLLNIAFWPKTEQWSCRTSQKTEQFTNIELFFPRLATTKLSFFQSFFEFPAHCVEKMVDLAAMCMEVSLTAWKKSCAQ